MRASNRKRRDGQRGQVLALFLLVLITMIMMAAVAVAVGQTLVRRQQAQMVVDAAAYAGAAKQAEGMNTIAHLNQDELDFQNAIHLSLILPYVDDDGTTQERFLLPTFYTNDWAGDTIKDYQKVFDFMNDMIGLVDKYYSMADVIKGPSASAKKVVDNNFGGDSNGDQLFRGESPAGQGVLLSNTSITNMDNLVQLSGTTSYAVEGYQYVSIEMAEMADLCADSFGFDFYHCTILANYGIANLYFEAKGQIDPIKFKFGRFYANNQSEVRFAYYLKVDNTPAIFGRNFFKDIPRITVGAAAKPYGGYLGNTFSTDFGNFWTSQGSKEISATYKAKLVPLNSTEKLMLAAESDDAEAALGVTH